MPAQFFDDDRKIFRLDRKIKNPVATSRELAVELCEEIREFFISFVAIEFGAVIKNMVLEIFPEGLVDRLNAGKFIDIVFELISELLMGFFPSAQNRRRRNWEEAALPGPDCKSRGSGGGLSNLRSLRK